MFKRLLVSVLIGISIISFSNFGYATSKATVPKEIQKIDTSKYELLNPEKDNFSTESKIILISGKAPTGAEISIEVYGTTDLTKKSFNLDKLPEEKDYIKTSTEVAVSGNMGFFKKEMDLIMGINKIIIDFGLEELPPVELIVYVYDKAIAEKDINNLKDFKVSDMILMKK